MTSFDKIRFSNFELLRLVLMAMIIIHHGIVCGLHLQKLSDINSGNLLIESEKCINLWGGVNAFCIIAVNSFVLLSGYFSIKIRLERIVSFLIQVAIYTVCLISVPYFLADDVRHAISSLMILSHTPYWFVTEYLVLMFFAPMINDYCSKLSRRYFTVTIIILLIISSYLGFCWNYKDNPNGYYLLQFITMYMIGRYIGLYDISVSIKKSVLSYILFTGCTWLLFSHFINEDRPLEAWKMMFYNNPFVIGASIAFVMIFKTIRIQSRHINYLSKSSFSIYLIQCSALGDVYYTQVAEYYIKYGDIGAVAIIVVTVILITLIAILIDPVQRKINGYLTNKFINIVK